MGATFSGMFGVTDEEHSDEHMQLSDLGGFLFKYIFIMLDKDKKKSVSKQEYLRLVNHFQELKTTEEELDNFLKKYAEEGNTTDGIDENLFKKLVVQLAIDFDRNIVERMKYLLTLFDKDKDGFVSEADLCEVYDAIGIQVPKEPIRCLISKFDVDMDGKLSGEEFEQLGRSAMIKLFIKKDEASGPLTEEDVLVNEAIQRASLFTGNSHRMGNFPDTKLRGFGDAVHPDIFNNNLVKDAMAAALGGVGEKLRLGKPVVLEDLDLSKNPSLIVGEASEDPKELCEARLEESSGIPTMVAETVVDNVS